MKKKLIGIILVVSLLSISFSLLADISNEQQNHIVNIEKHNNSRGKEITVNKEGGGDFYNIQSAVDSALSGDTIIVYPGEYDENVVINTSSLKLIGTGDDVVRVISHNSQSVFTINSDDNEVSGFELHVTYTLGSYGISVRGDNNLIYNCTVEIGYGSVSFYSSQNNLVRDCDLGRQVSIMKSNDIIISNCSVKSNDWQKNGISIFESYHCTIDNCTISESYIGLQIEMSNNSVIDNCIVFDNDYGIKLLNYDNCTIMNTYCKVNEYEGIELDESPDNMLINITCTANEYGIHINGDNNQILDSFCNRNRENGLYIFRSDNCIVYRTEVYDNEYSGIGVSGNDCEIQDCISDGNKKNGFSLYGFQNTIENCIATNNTVSGIKCSCDNGSIENCISRNNEDGFYFYSADHSYLIDCIAESNDASGFEIYSDESSLIQGCTFSNNTRGVTMKNTESAIFRHNVIINNLKVGIRLDRLSSNNTFVSNDFIHNNVKN